MAQTCPLQPATLCNLEQLQAELVRVRGDLKQAEARLADAEEELREARQVIGAIQAGDVDALVVTRQDSDRILAIKGVDLTYRTLVESMNEGAAVVGADLAVLFCNQQLSAILGLPVEQIVGQPAARLLQGENDQLEALLVRSLDGDAVKTALTVHTPAGQQVPVQISLHRMPGDEPAAIAMVVTDLTELRKWKASWRESETAFSVLANHVPQLVWMCTPDGRGIYFNSRWVDYTGLTLEESRGTRWIVPIHPQERRQAWNAWTLSVRTGARYRFEGRLRQADGTWRWFLFQAEPLCDSDGKVTRWFGTCTDIEDLKHAEQEQRSQREQLRALAEKLHRVREDERIRVARDLHDRVGQLFTAMRMDLAWMERRLPADDHGIKERISGTVELINDGVKSVRRICAELRPPILDDLGLPAAIEWEMKQFASRTGISYQVHSSPEKLRLDRDRATALFRIFQECITNVARHAEATLVEIALLQQDGALMLSVKDDGKGFQTRERNRSLGLLGMKERAEGCGGGIEFVSSPGKGTTVVVQVPHLPA